MGRTAIICGVMVLITLPLPSIIIINSIAIIIVVILFTITIIILKIIIFIITRQSYQGCNGPYHNSPQSCNKGIVIYYWNLTQATL